MYGSGQPWYLAARASSEETVRANASALFPHGVEVKADPPPFKIVNGEDGPGSDRASSRREGVRTARETAAQSICLGGSAPPIAAGSMST